MHYKRLVLSLATLALMANAIPHNSRDDSAAYRPSVYTYTSDAENIDKRDAQEQGILVRLSGNNAGVPVDAVQSKVSPPAAKPTGSDGHVFEQVGSPKSMLPRGKKPAGQGEIGDKKKHGGGSGSGSGKKQQGGQPKPPSGQPKEPNGSSKPSGSSPAAPAGGSPTGSPKPQGSSPAAKSGKSKSKSKSKSKKQKGQGQGSGSSQLPEQQQGGKDVTSGSPANAGGDTFNIQVVNSCPDTKTVGIFGVTSSFQGLQDGQNQVIPSGGTATLPAPFHGIGLRLTANADQGVQNVFQAQSLFEFGFSSFAGQDGTSYDLSLMQGAQIGMAVQVLDNGNGSGSCESKSCPSPSNCPASQGWTNPDQVNIGSPADTTCYKGKTDFKLTLCP